MPNWFSDFELHLFTKGTFYRAYEKMGAHPVTKETDKDGFNFAVWAPNATSVTVIGDFNAWDRNSNILESLGGSGIWCGIVENAREGQAYKFQIENSNANASIEKADPYAFFTETAPRTASRLWVEREYGWADQEWIGERGKNRNWENEPISIYEIHLSSWQKVPNEMNRSLSFKELSGILPTYLKEMGFTHVEFLPPFEHPFEGSWGYQVTGYFAPLSRLGTPDELKDLINALHVAGIGVIIDWVPAHFPNDEHALAKFDGTSLYEHADPKQGLHPDWQTLIFNFGRKEVSNFLIASAMFWCEKFHIDGIRVDAVASMLYLDYSRKQDEWIPNKYGGRENLDAVEFLKHFNSQIKINYPAVMTIAEESTAWPNVTVPVESNGLGFDFKWNMGWMNDTLEYFEKDPIYRRHHHGQVTFGLVYAFSEKFMLPFSHDEVVHGKKSLLEKMPGSEEEKFAHLRKLYSFLYFYPGKKLLFMGSELAQRSEWNHDTSLDWESASNPLNQGVKNIITDLNRLYTDIPALHEQDCSSLGFDWISCEDVDQSVFCFYRISKKDERVAVIVNATPVGRDNYRIGLRDSGEYEEIFNSNSHYYGGNGEGNLGLKKSEKIAFHGFGDSINIYLPPLSVVAFRLKPAVTR